LKSECCPGRQVGVFPSADFGCLIFLPSGFASQVGLGVVFGLAFVLAPKDGRRVMSLGPGPPLFLEDLPRSTFFSLARLGGSAGPPSGVPARLAQRVGQVFARPVFSKLRSASVCSLPLVSIGLLILKPIPYDCFPLFLCHIPLPGFRTHCVVNPARLLLGISDKSFCPPERFHPGRTPSLPAFFRPFALHTDSWCVPRSSLLFLYLPHSGIAPFSRIPTSRFLLPGAFSSRIVLFISRRTRPLSPSHFPAR